MKLTVFFPPPGVKRGAALFYLWLRGFCARKAFGGRAVVVPRPRERIKTKQKNYLIQWIEIEVYDRRD